jgi:hypothetical protein
MSEAKVPLFESKPVAVCVNQGVVVTQEFVSPDGHVMAGYHAIPDAVGFPAWARQGNIVAGFRETDRQWFPTAEAARAWVLACVNGRRESLPVSAPVSSGARQRTEAA